MHLDITQFFTLAAPMDYAASAAEIGQQAGEDTWRAAVEDSPDYMLLDNKDKREQFRDYMRKTGGWDAKEIKAFNDRELNALCIQFISGDIREAGLTPDSTREAWDAYYKRSEAGKVSGRITRTEDGKVYYYVGE